VQDRRVNPRVGLKPIADVGSGENLAGELINRPRAAPMQMLGVTPDDGIVWDRSHLGISFLGDPARALALSVTRGYCRQAVIA
jgi:hypothetical protein